MQNLKRNLKIVIQYAKNSIKSTIQNKLGVVLFTTGKVVRFSIFFLFAYYLIANSGVLKGYTVNQAIVFYLTYNIIDTITQALFREVYRFRDQVVTGTLDHVLIKPMHPFLKVLLGGTDILDFMILIPYIGLTIFFISQIGNITPLGIFLYFILVLNGVLIAMSFHILVLAFGLLTTQVDQAMWIYRDVSELGRFPFEIYTSPVRTFFTFVIPIGVMVAFPPRALYGLLSPSLVIYSFILAAIMVFISIKLWSMGLRRYQSFGG